VQRTGLRPEGTGRVCWQWRWFAVESCSSALPLTPTVRCFAEKQNQEQMQNQVLSQSKFCRLAKVFFYGGFDRLNLSGFGRLFFFVGFGSGFQFVGL
jgi:hypothetical protein